MQRYHMLKNGMLDNHSSSSVVPGPVKTSFLGCGHVLVADGTVIELANLGCILSLPVLEAFSHHLSEQNELMQELTSQGVNIIYELCDASMKKNLVNALVGTLTGLGKRKRVVKKTLKYFKAMESVKPLAHIWKSLDAMAHIWKSLVSDPKHPIDEHLGAILDDLISQCESPLQRSS